MSNTEPAPRIPVTDLTLRIPPNTFFISITTVLAIAGVFGVTRLAFQILRRGTLCAGDAAVATALAFFAAGVGVLYKARTLMYQVFYAELGVGPAVGEQNTALFYLLDEIASAFLWMSIFAIRMFYVWFFGKAMERLRLASMWWWGCMLMLIASACVNILIGLGYCNIGSIYDTDACDGVVDSKRRALIISTTLDIFTSAIVFCIPIVIFVKARVTLRAALGLSLVLATSIVLSFFALIRALYARDRLTPAEVIHFKLLPEEALPAMDSAWSFFWLVLEAAVGICLASFSSRHFFFGPPPPPPHDPRHLRFSYQSRRQPSTFTLNHDDLVARLDKLAAPGMYTEFPPTRDSIFLQVDAGPEFQRAMIPPGRSFDRKAYIPFHFPLYRPDPPSDDEDETLSSRSSVSTLRSWEIFRGKLELE